MSVTFSKIRLCYITMDLTMKKRSGYDIASLIGDGRTESCSPPPAITTTHLTSPTGKRSSVHTLKLHYLILIITPISSK